MARLPVAATTLGLATPMAGATTTASPSSLKTVPRNRTFISVGVGGEAPERFTDVEMQNPLLRSITRSGFQIAMEPLFYYNPYNTTTVCGPPDIPQCRHGEIPWIGVNYLYDADFTSVVINLREGVTWSDGQPFTAHDVVFTVNLLRDNAPGLRWSIDMARWVKDVVALDAFSVRFSLTQPNPRFVFGYFINHEDFGIQIVPRHIFEGKDPRTFTNFDLKRGWPVVTGPFRLVHSDSQQKIWDRRDDWWAMRAGFHPLPSVERMIFLPGFSEAKMVDLIDRNEVDTTLNLKWSNIRRALDGNHKVTSWTGSRGPYGYVDYYVTGLGFNDQQSPFDDAEIRWAINHAIDRDQLVAIGYHGSGDTAVLPYPDFPALRPYLNGVADLVKKYGPATFDPSLTARTLTGKGYARGQDGFWSRQGARLKIPLTTFSVEEDITTALVDQLRDEGFDASFTVPSDYRTPILTGAAPAYIFGHVGSVRGPYESMLLYHSRYAAPVGKRAVHPYRWKNAEFDRIVDRMSTISNQDRQIESVFRQAIDVWLKNLPDIPLVQYYHRIPVNTTYWTGWPNATNPYINTANWHLTFALVILSLKPA